MQKVSAGWRLKLRLAGVLACSLCLRPLYERSFRCFAPGRFRKPQAQSTFVALSLAL